MKNNKTVLLFAVMTFLLVGCGSRAAALAEQSAEVEFPGEVKSPAQAPATAVSTTPADAPGTRPVVTISLGDNTIDSSQTTFKVGVIYKFVITNYGDHPHTFTINEPVAAKGSYQGALSGALLIIDTDQLGPGETVTFEFAFPPEGLRKTWEFSSLKPNAYEDGMRWPIMVVQ
jgi:uncharacterized cupredoxin-like copper-binding protein